MKREPVITATILVPGIVALAAWLGFELDPETALQIGGALVVIGGLVARHFVTPTAETVDAPRRRPRKPRPEWRER